MVSNKIQFIKRKSKKNNKTKIKYLTIWFKRQLSKHKYSINRNKKKNYKAQIKYTEKHQATAEANRQRQSVVKVSKITCFSILKMKALKQDLPISTSKCHRKSKVITRLINNLTLRTPENRHSKSRMTKSTTVQRLMLTLRGSLLAQFLIALPMRTWRFLVNSKTNLI